ncbi:MAG: Transglutaminase protein [Candidatus Peregrinibacteria bacterium Greene1014_49]|nr:MAG: Transglutaminase protein [Candidatus Peregrinibacteria bacterium Greene1014_49]
MGRTLVLDALGSRGLGEKTTYRWYRDNISIPISRSVEVVYTPDRSGVTVFRVVITSAINGEQYEITAEKTITVYRHKIALIANMGVSGDKLALHAQAAAAAGAYVRIVQPAGAILDSEQALTTAITEQADALTGAESIILWTDGLTGIQGLSNALEALPDRRAALANQTIVMISDESLPRLARTVRGHFAVLQPDRILVTRKEAINPIIAAENIDAALMELAQRDIDLVVVDETTAGIRPWNLLSSLVNFMLMHGVSSQTVMLLLMLPLIATILAFLKQVIGMTTFGLYAPSIVALSFLALGWKIGLLFLLAIVATGYATRSFMRRWRLLYIPKVAIIITVVSLTLLVLVAIAAAIDVTFARDTIFVLLIMSTLAESFLTVKTGEGWWSAIIGIGETIAASLLCVAIVQWSSLQSLILAYPELILLTIVVNIALGRWTGLRLVEYVRFREVFRHLQEE